MVRRGLAGLIVVAAACSPFGATAIGDADGGAFDAATGGPTPIEGGPPPGAIGDASLDGRVSPCLGGQHVICTDFDRATPWEGWQRVEATGAPVELDTTTFLSPPASMGIRVAPAQSSDHPSFIYRELGQAQRIVVQADVRVLLSAPQAPNGEIDVLTLELEPPSGFNRYFVGIIVTGDGNYVLETNMQPTSEGTLKQTPIIGTVRDGFVRVGLDLDLTAGTVTGLFDGRVTTVELRPAQGTGHRVEVGASWASNSVGTYLVNVDNIVLDQ